VDPLRRISLLPGTGLSCWWPDNVGVTAVMLPALTLLDFSLGVLAGAIIRRTVPAMAPALAAGLVTGSAMPAGGCPPSLPPRIGRIPARVMAERLTGLRGDTGGMAVRYAMFACTLS
jgi:hypothetical protein